MCLPRARPIRPQRANMSIDSILHGIAEFDFRPEFPDAVPRELRNLAMDCWHGTPQRRLPFAEVAPQLRTALEVRPLARPGPLPCPRGCRPAPTVATAHAVVRLLEPSSSLIIPAVPG